MIGKYIYSLGLELEGGINSISLSRFEKEMANEIENFDDHYSVGEDGSVSVGCPQSFPYEYCRYWISNIEIRFWHYDLNTIIYFVKRLWAHLFRQNHTCGNHMHIRFTNLVYASIFSLIEAQNMFIDEYKKRYSENSKYLYRLENRYSTACLDQDCINDNMLNPNGSRYRAINFRSITDKKYKTLEIRIMPYANNANELIDMIMFNIRTIDMIIERFTINGNIVVKAFDLKDIKRLYNKNGKKKKLMIREVY